MLPLAKGFFPTALVLLSVLPLFAVQESKNPNVRFGLPATVNADRAHHLIERPQYVLSYNAKTHTPN